MLETRDCFTPTYLLESIKEELTPLLKDNVQNKFSTIDCLMSAFAMFHLKFPSLLQFDQTRLDEPQVQNIRTLYHVNNIPSDTQMRTRLDEVDCNILNMALKKLISIVQRIQNLALYNTEIMEKGVIVSTKTISLDGTQFFISDEVHCLCCMEKHHRNGRVTYHHQMLVGSLVHPSYKQVFPVLFEPISNQDGSTKNDCERNASKRWLKNYRSLYPHMPTTIVEDGLASNAPHINALKNAHCRFILGAKKDDHKYLYDWFFSASEPDCQEFVETKDHFQYKYRFMNDVPLNDENADVKVNVLMLDLEELPHCTKRGKPKKESCLQKTRWVWITDYNLDQNNVSTIAKTARARWRIENETFNTLKNQGYHFEHNFVHGYKALSNVLAGKMIVAFLYDQILLAFNKNVQKALEKKKRLSYLFQHMLALFLLFFIDDLEQLYRAIFEPPRRRNVNE